MRRFSTIAICTLALTTLSASANAPGSLGIRQMECRCTVTTSEDGTQSWHFKEEPRIAAVDPKGPAAGKLEDGDIIVAIDGLLITTRKAGRRFGSVRAGEPVRLTVRRMGETMVYTLSPVETTAGLAVPAPELDSAMTVRLERLAEEVEALSRYAAELSRVAERIEIPEPPELPELPELPVLPEIPSLPPSPAGSYGFGLSFGGSIQRQKDTDLWQWRFDSPPTVISVDPDGPAARAGIERGDVLTHINGQRVDSKAGGERFSSAKPGDTVTWTVRRGRETLTIEMTVGDRQREGE